MTLTVALFVLAVGIEILLRWRLPKLSADLFLPPEPPGESPFLYNDEVGYEIKPFAKFKMPGISDSTIEEPTNSEGFRNKEIPKTKPARELRLAAIGDSVCHACHVSRQKSWEHLLEEKLKKMAPRWGRSSVKVINAGVYGYVSTQMLTRFKTRVAKYQPDLVLLVGGWNDLVFSSLPFWKPGIHLADFGIPRGTATPVRESFLKKYRLAVYRISFILRGIRDLKNKVVRPYLKKHKLSKLITNRQIDSHIPGIRLNNKFWMRRKKLKRLGRWLLLISVIFSSRPVW